MTPRCGAWMPIAKKECTRPLGHNGKHQDAQASAAKRRANPKRKASNAKYAASPKGKASNAKYDRSPKRKASNAKYDRSPKRKASHAKYSRSPKGKAAIAKYEASPKGKAARTKWVATTIKGATRHTRENMSPDEEAVLLAEMEQAMQIVENNLPQTTKEYQELLEKVINQ